MRALIVFAAVLGLAPPAHAERILTLEEALALGRQNSRDLGAARARLEQAAAGVTQAWVALLPTLTVQGKYTHNYREVTLDLSRQNEVLFGMGQIIARDAGNPILANDLASYETGVRSATPTNFVIQKREQLDAAANLTVPLVVPSAYPALDAAKKTVASARATFEVSETTILFAVAQAFFTSAGADEIVVARRHAIEVARTTLVNAQARLEAGVVNRVEVMRAELALVRAVQAEKEAVQAEAQAYRALATLTQLPPPFRVAPAETRAGSLAAVEELTQQALKLRPDFAVLERNIDAATAQVRASKWRWAPTLSGFGNARAFNYSGFSGDRYAWLVGVQLDWILYDGGARDSARELAWAQKRESQARLELLRDTVRDEVANAVEVIEIRRQALETARRSMALSRETLNLVRVQHDAGTATQLDLLQAQDSLVAAEVTLAQARFDLLLADLSLERTVGTFPSSKGHS